MEVTWAKSPPESGAKLSWTIVVPTATRLAATPAAKFEIAWSRVKGPPRPPLIN